MGSNMTAAIEVDIQSLTAGNHLRDHPRLLLSQASGSNSMRLREPPAPQSVQPYQLLTTITTITTVMDVTAT
jgi:hypothetical protein